MRKSKRWEFVPVSFVETLHDEWVVSFWAFDEPVRRDEYRNKALLESAVNRPFQTAFGIEIHATVFAKAAALFHSLIANHPFTNGNKRTAVLAVDMFLLAQDYCLVLEKDEIYRLAKITAQHNELGIAPEAMVDTIQKRFEKYSLPLDKIGGSKERDELKMLLVKERRAIRTVITTTRIIDVLRGSRSSDRGNSSIVR